MTLKNFLAAIIGILPFAFAYAGNHDTGHFPNTRSPFSDSTGIDDSLKQGIPVNDPKQEFRNLFMNSSLPVGINAQKINPQMISFVEDYTNRYGKKLESIKDRCKPYLDIMDDILEEHGLPKELKYLAVIESDLKTNARSWAGAVGPWQFMPTTARNMGLRVNKKYDERTNFAKSTRAACKYLTDLYVLYEDWLLVIAAYNGGPGKVNSAIKKSGSRDFWTLQKYLPAESQSHVKKFIATHYFMEGQGGIVTSTKNELKNAAANTLTPEEMALSKTQNISGRYNSLVIVKHLVMDIAVFNKMNPDFDRLIGNNGAYELRLPSDKMELFLVQKPEILNESLQLLLNQAEAPGS
ncbi:MAG: lytic transglycosylase domain-containing protein [Bacteroidota bacterium]|nr:lytic transglycosylase domain-containing protein [Bacteroidota bacterium]